MKATVISTDPKFRFRLNMDLSEEFNKLQPNFTEKSLTKLINKTFREKCPEQFKRLNGRFTKDWEL